jgi:hypothetical protein
VAEGECRRHRPLPAAKRPTPAPHRTPGEPPEPAYHDEGGQRGEHGTDREPDQGSEDADRMPVLDPSPVDRVDAGRNDRSADEPPDQRVTGGRWQPEPPSDQIPGDRRGEPRSDHLDRFPRIADLDDAPIVSATAAPTTNGPRRLSAEAKTIACSGVAARVAEAAGGRVRIDHGFDIGAAWPRLVAYVTHRGEIAAKRPFLSARESVLSPTTPLSDVAAFDWGPRAFD